MRALILGGSRYIGRRLAAELADAGHQVTLFNRGRAGDGLGDRVERLRGDRRSAADLRATLERREFDVAYDFLAYDAGDTLLAVEALSCRVGHFVHISTCSVYWCTGDFPCPVPEEDFARLSDFEERPGSIEYAYGYAKRKAEEALFAAHARSGFPATAIRIPIVAGEDDYTKRYASYCLRVADGQPLILPDGGFAPFRHVYVGDVTRTLASLPSVPAAIGQAYNLACDEILSVRIVVDGIAGLLGRRPEIVDAPTGLLKSIMSGEAVAGFSPLSQRAAQIPSVRKARRELGWSPTPFPVWLERAVRWAVDANDSWTEPPPACAWRAMELETVEILTNGFLSLGGPDATFSGPRG